MKARIALACVFLGLASFAASAAPAVSQQEQQACMNDAFNVCGHAIPDRDRVAACLYQNVNRVSGACRVVLQRYSKQAPVPASRVTATRF